jgi:hypothetical protein
MFFSGQEPIGGELPAARPHGELRKGEDSPLVRRLIMLALCAAAALTGPRLRAQAGSAAPLPDPKLLLERALANEKKLADEQERYECRVTSDGAELDKNGKVKHETVTISEQFYVNGQQIERTLSKNGKDLTDDQTRKEDGRVMKETLKYSDKAKADKQTAKDDQQIIEMLSAMMLANGRRETVNGRSVLLYDVVANPHFQAKNLNQRFASVMQGRISLDEQTGEMVDLNIRSVEDLKIAGGVIATLHKGFWLHIHSTPQPDGVWLNDLSEGTGDARALLFVHPYFRFKEVTDSCHLYTATASQAAQATLLKK